ncbi:glycosyltransferase involved in cell wall biosynthesis [Enterococcus sp. PF1-24]|uniref:glycosyltransferase family 2 protein n=1 Tax=unclassified Enterococcus TaxID=2608891 RepID=UPI002473D771|nr:MULTISPECIES: glycosyltransferase family 2 protein [unclassified Enterococcus]MDH6364553.1 glycosyltransferase involved in cell wall biosynthesis [Enterococcus sp. PFB1-1]MDH6401654.1 glycosyltransferase involved in cell wall biosynthesis [Enterococcus sp. PF1-24]
MISVCLATYNGAQFIEKQLRSILAQLTATDEVIIVDDNSTDQTLTIIKALQQDYSASVNIYQNKKNLGPIASFEKALTLTKGDYIFFSDQDDQWFPEKVASALAAFQKDNSDLFLHDGVVIGPQGEELDASWNHYHHNQVQQGLLGNLKKNAYTGAMMAISRRLADASLPFPAKIEMHDQWFFLVAKKRNFKITISEKALMNYVRHGNNVTGMHKRPLTQQLLGRLQMLKAYLFYSAKEKNNKLG